ncbi:hypothetical protein GCM10009759_74950 [Kitasatospora saccharophila]|uniref:Methylase-associated X1 domain-containing protein n=2 Tax=Kitasatospora saccharophila TaxID=407973 RepID=A0ABP5JWI1_9ACTN
MLPLELSPPWLEMPEEQFKQRYGPRQKTSTAFLGRTLLRSLNEVLANAPSERALTKKPLTVNLSPPLRLAPLPRELRFYIFNATQNSGERKQDAFKIQLSTRPADAVESGKSARYKFDRSGNILPILVGYYAPLNVYILWDADLHDLGAGYSYSNSVYSKSEVVYEAAALGVAESDFRLRNGIVENIIAARSDALVEGLKRRIKATVDRSLGGW